MDILIYKKKKNLPFGNKYKFSNRSFSKDTGKLILTKYSDLDERKLEDDLIFRMLEALKEINMVGVKAHISLGAIWIDKCEDDFYLKLSDTIAIVLTISDPRQEKCLEDDYVCLWKSPKGMEQPFEFFSSIKDANEVTKEDWINFFTFMISTHLIVAKNRMRGEINKANIKAKTATKKSQTKRTLGNLIYNLIEAQQEPQV